tara:strand:+ start:558 stop:1529 length:972 start_codon:yes stop_codon:yes gene_type:complete
MEKLLSELREKRNVTESTIRVYERTLHALSKLINKEEFKNINFLKTKQNVILKELENMSSSKKKNYLASILVALSPERGQIRKGYKDNYDKYKDLLTAEHKAYTDRVNKKEMTSKEKENMVTFKELEKVRQKYENNVKHIGYTQKSEGLKKAKHLDLLQKYLLASIYTLMPPRRNAYAKMKIIKYKDYDKLPESEKQDNNYLVIYSRNKKKFAFGDFKTKKTFGLQEITIPKRLNSIINLWLHFNPNKEYLLIDKRGKAMTHNGLTKYLNKVFEPTGKKISTTMLRKIYLTSKYGKLTEEMAEDAEKMGHSKSTQQKYIKKKD